MESSKVVLVTGANTGLGYQIVKALFKSKKSYQLLLGGRSIEKATQATQEISNYCFGHENCSKITPVQIDIEDDDSIKGLYRKVKADFGRIDVLINNAGAQFDQRLQDGTMTARQVWTQSWAVNVVGTQMLTDALMPLLLKSSDARLVFLASGTSSLGLSENLESPLNKVPARGWPKDRSGQMHVPAYRSAKAGMNMMMREWHRSLKEDGVKVWAISPGYLATGLGGSREMNKSRGAADPEIGGELVKEVVEGRRDGDVGKVILRDGVQPW